MFNVVGLNERDVTSAESFTEALRILYNRCIEPIARGEKPQDSETTCYNRGHWENGSRSHVLPIRI